MKQKLFSALLSFTTVFYGLAAKAQTYCSPYESGSNGSCIYNGGILKVTFSELDNTSTCSGDNYSYADYTATNGLLANVSLNQTYTIQVQMQEPSAGSGAALWIDFNKNGVFESSEYYNLGTLASASTLGTFTASVSIPGTATAGTTRMRVRTRRGAAVTATNACGISGTHRGEAEDYNIKIINNCTTPTGINLSNITDSSAKLKWDLSDSPHEYFISTDGTNAPTAMTTATARVPKSYDTAGLKNLAPGTQYYVWVRTACNSADKSNWSNVSNFQTTSPAVPLAIFFKEIYAITNSADNSVFFSIANHSDTYNGFELERSSDSKSFIKINSGKLNRAQEVQIIKDYNPLRGTNYYRIAIQEDDGTTSYSKVCKVNTANQKNQMVLYPNPVHGNRIHVQSDLFRSDNPQVAIYDLSGNKMNIQLLSGSSPNNLVIDMANIVPGVYYLKYQQELIRFIKTR